MDTLKLLLERKMRDEGLSLREAAKKIGVSHNTIVHVRKGDEIDLGTLFKISNWLNVLPATLLNSANDDALAMQIAVLLERNPTLASVFRDALQKVVSEEIDLSIIEEVVAYAVFRMMTKGT
jgi:transcriptional regulator with XRE-family HTH domain